MSDTEKCVRCGEVAETYNWEKDTTFWGWFGLGTATATKHLLRVKSQYFQRNPDARSPGLLSDEMKPLCGDCWGLLVGRFMQGRSVEARPGKEGW